MTERGLTRRGVLGVMVGGATYCWAARRALAEDSAQGPSVTAGPSVGLTARPARWWHGLGDKKIQCDLCPQACRVADRERGTCGVRENRGGSYVTLVYGRPCSLHVDPIEKKPFHHVLPGTNAFSLAAPGCNMQCKFCQNWEISQVRPEQVTTFDKSPSDIVGLAKQFHCPTIACTYSEPVVWSEYVCDIAAAAKKAAVRTLVVSNGFIQAQAMTDVASVVAAVKIDLKAFTEPFYREQCGGALKPVLDTLRLLAKKKMWTEIVVLLIPGLNDGEAEVRALAHFVHDELGPDVPLHFSRFHPSYRLQNVPSTPVATLTRARQVAMDEGLRFVYVGNVLAHPGNNTYCPGCKAILIRRVGMAVVDNRLQGGRCPDCKRVIPGIWS